MWFSMNFILETNFFKDKALNSKFLLLSVISFWRKSFLKKLLQLMHHFKDELLLRQVSDLSFFTTASFTKDKFPFAASFKGSLKSSLSAPFQNCFLRQVIYVWVVLYFASAVSFIRRASFKTSLWYADFFLGQVFLKLSFP